MQMVFKKFLFCIANIFGPRGGWRRIKVPSFFEAINVADDQPRNTQVVVFDDDDNEGFDSVEESGEDGRRMMLEMKMCCVCLSEMEERGEDRRSLPCSHEFHRECVERWLENVRRKTCPLCRFLMEDGEEKTVKRDEDDDRVVLTDEMMVWFSSFHAAGF